MGSENTTRSLSQFQSLVWLGQLLQPEAPLYNTAFQIGLPFEVDRSTFERAFRYLVSDSDILRSTVTMEQGIPHFFVHDALDFEIEFVDLSSERSPKQAADRWCNSACSKPFVLDKCLFETALLKLGNQEYCWFINQHHIACDAWSVSVLSDRLSQVYDAIIRGDSIDTLPNWQDADRPAPSQNNVAATKHHVATRYFGVSAEVSDSSSTRHVVVADDDDLGSRLNQLAQLEEARSFSQDMSLFQVTLAIYAAYLFRITAQQEISIGIPFHHRTSPAAQQQLGAYIEFYPITLNHDDDETFLSLLKKVQTETTRFLRQAMSAGAAQTSSRSFTAIMNFINAKFPNFHDHPVDVQWLHPGCHDREHPIRLHVFDYVGSGTPELQFDLNHELYGDRRPQMVGHLRRMIQAVAVDPHQVLASIDLLSAQERGRQLATFNDSPPASRQPDVVTLIRQSTIDHPDQVALQSTVHTWTYNQFDRLTDYWAAQIAQHLQPDNQLVMICMPRSAEAVAAMVATLKAGGAFVPIDPSWPEERRQFVSSNCAAKVGMLLPNADRPHTETPVADDNESITWLQLDATPPDSKSGNFTPKTPDAESLAYVLYTSGSTGRPKGVQITHGNLANYTNWAISKYCRGQRLTFPLFTPLTFDLTITSIFVPLSSGGTTRVYPEQSENFDLAILDVVADNEVNIIKCTPSHLQMLSDTSLHDSRVRQLILGGEDLRWDLATQILNRFPAGVAIHNEYGPTEATVGCIVHTVDNSTEHDALSVPIGQPIAGMQAYVLSESGQLQPEGVPGHLHLAGAGLAKGYLAADDLTADRFIDNPFDDGRLYRTGDMVRFNRDGVLEYLGRNDQQVKIRGARIELGAIETAIESHPRIANAVVTTFGSSDTALTFCARCGIASNYPEIDFDNDNICNLCRSFDGYQERATEYFKPLTELTALLSGPHPHHAAPYDCLVLLSGGKDSTYMVARLADMGLRVLSFTLDNGYISDEAKANIRRVVETLGIDHHFASTDSMNAIFVDSLRRHANVCQGCFKTIYTLALQFADEKQIPFIVTGLSRGQFFETRLTAELFADPCASLTHIDDTVLEARKAYHRVDDAVSQLMDVESLQSGTIFERVRIVDFYRFCDVSLDEMYRFMDERLPWVRPSDTGRSTNCLINDVGIYVHKRQKGFHNYALPYSWDVRLGHKQRDAALDELDDRIDPANVHRILREIGFHDTLEPENRGPRLVAYFVADEPITSQELDSHLRNVLPDFMVPSTYVPLEELPLSHNGKLDRSALPNPTRVDNVIDAGQELPANEAEQRLATIWKEVLQLPSIGVESNFFDLGGDSILAIQIVAKANKSGITITPAQMFDALTIRGVVRQWENQSHDALRHDDVDATWSPIQFWCLEHQPTPDEYWVQSVELQARDNLSRMQHFLASIINEHSALRTHANLENGAAVTTAPLKPDQVPWQDLDLRELASNARQSAITAAENKLYKSLRFGAERLLGGFSYRITDDDVRYRLAANHLASDAVTWSILLEELRHRLKNDSDSKSDLLDSTASNSASHATWAHRLRALPDQSYWESQTATWTSILTAPPPIRLTANLPQTSTVGDVARLETRLDATTTAKLRTLGPANRTTAHELLLSALFVTMSDWSNQKTSRIFVERHGRNAVVPDVDVSQSIGWFTNLAPVATTVTPGSTREQLDSAVESIRKIPDEGVGYSILRYLHSSPEIRDALTVRPGHEVVFNFLGREPTPAEVLPVVRPLTLHQSNGITRFAALDVALSLGSQLSVAWQFPGKWFATEEIQTLAERYLLTVARMIDAALEENGVKSAADFPLAALNNAQLQDMAALLNAKNSKRGNADGA